jgi:hypothetical protein
MYFGEVKTTSSAALCRDKPVVSTNVTLSSSLHHTSKNGNRVALKESLGKLAAG